MASKTIQNIIRNIFDPNLTGNISAGDLQYFVDAVFESTESVIKKFDSLDEVTLYSQTKNTPIEKGDLVIVDLSLYLARVTKPGKDDLNVINDISILNEGQQGEILYAGSTGPFWATLRDGYYIKGQLDTKSILSRQEGLGTIYICTDDTTSGKKGDGFSFDGQTWNNIGSLVGPKGDVTELLTASADEVNQGLNDQKAITPQALRDSDLLSNKENVLSYPNKDGMVLISSVMGAKTWRNINEAHNTIDRPKKPYVGQMIFDRTLCLPLWYQETNLPYGWVSADGKAK